jgi:hypothetical protein
VAVEANKAFLLAAVLQSIWRKVEKIAIPAQNVVCNAAKSGKV